MRASIVIAVHNEGVALQRTIQACLETAGRLDFELVVADDASTDGSVEQVAQHFPPVRLVRHPQRRGASPTKALGARAAHGAVLVFLDGHTNPAPGALERLVQAVERLDGEAILTPAIAALQVERWQNDLSQVGHGYGFELQRLECRWLPLAELPRSTEGRFYESPALIGCAFALSRELYERLWGFDARMRSWGVEDLDLSLKAWLLGYRILHDPEVVIGHRFRQQFDSYTVPLEDVLVNQLRLGRKHFTSSVWESWLGETRERSQGLVDGHPEGVWARAWQLFEETRESVEQERAYLQAHRVQDEFWYARHFSLPWPRLRELSGQQLSVRAGESRAQPRGAAVTHPGAHPRNAELAPSPPPPPNVAVVNMIPKALSGEHNQDSEPTLAINPADTTKMAATAFTPNPAGSGNAPIYVSTDGGQTWVLNAIVQSQIATADITVAFGDSGTNLYAGIIRLPMVDKKPRLNIQRTNNFTANTPMQVLVDRTGTGVDQPYVQAATVAGNDHVYVGSNDFNGVPRTATVDLSLNAGTGATPFVPPIRIESRGTGNANQDAPSIRPAIHSDGTIYVAFFGWRSQTGGFTDITTDVVVVRDDNNGSGAHPFTALTDSDGHAGKRVVQTVHDNFNGFLGLERVGSSLAIAVDPTNSSTLYLAYADLQGAAKVYTLHVRKSTDKGVNWSADLLTISNATNPSLAINSAGTVGLLYQELSGTGAGQRWVTHFRRSPDGTNWDDLVLATAPANVPAKTFDPYLGDYVHLQAVDTVFFGVFCANNTPDMANFPSGVRYQRTANFTTHTLLDLTNNPVPASIDPFFFKVTS
jgi:GT2 family glycosyltransferase